jgi:hypothetical protein
MKFAFEKRSGNSYTIRNAVIEVDAELLGGGDGMLIMLHSIKKVEPLDEASSSTEALIEYFGEEIEKQKRFGTFVIIHKGKVVFSLDKALRRGSQISTKIRQKS